MSTATILLKNHPSRIICYVYLMPIASTAEVGDSPGPSEVVPPRVSRAFEVEPGVYDPLATDCGLPPTYNLASGGLVDERHGVLVQEIYIWDAREYPSAYSSAMRLCRSEKSSSEGSAPDSISSDRSASPSSTSLSSSANRLSSSVGSADTSAEGEEDSPASS